MSEKFLNGTKYLRQTNEQTEVPAGKNEVINALWLLCVCLHCPHFFYFSF